MKQRQTTDEPARRAKAAKGTVVAIDEDVNGEMDVDEAPGDLICTRKVLVAELDESSPDEKDEEDDFVGGRIGGEKNVQTPSGVNRRRTCVVPLLLSA